MDATSKTRRSSEGLSPLKQEFAQWRAGRKGGERIPVALWAQASEAAAEHGAYRVAVELHLDYADLKRRAARAAGTAGLAALAPQFVELFAPNGAVQTAAPTQPVQPTGVVQKAAFLGDTGERKPPAREWRDFTEKGSAVDAGAVRLHQLRRAAAEARPNPAA